uniref:Uncharacterized protein n=1 Tax=Arundo donax TaxID=35708 RepID=A0A0A9GUF2_ARUDO
MGSLGIGRSDPCCRSPSGCRRRRRWWPGRAPACPRSPAPAGWCSPPPAPAG